MSKIMERLFQQRYDGMYTILVERGAMRIEVGDDHGGTAAPIVAINWNDKVYRRETVGGASLESIKRDIRFFPDNWFNDTDPRWTKVEPMTEDLRVSVVDRNRFTCSRCQLRYSKGSDSYTNAFATGSTMCIPCEHGSRTWPDDSTSKESTK